MAGTLLVDAATAYAVLALSQNRPGTRVR